MTSPTPARLSLRTVSSPLLLAGSLAALLLLALFALDDSSGPEMGPWGRAATLLPLVLLALLTVLDSIHQVEIGTQGIRVISLAGLLLNRIFPTRSRRGRSFRLSWSSVDAVELRVSRFQFPFRRAVPRGWLMTGSPGRVVQIPFGHPGFRDALAMLRRFVHPYFLRLPSPEWEGRIPGRPALERMLRTVVFDPSAPSEFIAETARACLLWGNFSRAERLMELALAKQEGDVRILEEYFRLMKRLGRAEKAKPALEKLLALRDSPMDLVEMAEVHHAEGDEKSATEYLLRATGCDPASDLAHFLLGCLYAQREGLESTALDQWKKGLERARHPQLLGKLGETYRYHREILASPEFLHSERRRHFRGIWSNRLGLTGALATLFGIGWWWLRPESAQPFPGRSGALLLVGGLLMLAARLLRGRRSR